MNQEELFLEDEIIFSYHDYTGTISIVEGIGIIIIKEYDLQKNLLHIAVSFTSEVSENCDQWTLHSSFAQDKWMQNTPYREVVKDISRFFESKCIWIDAYDVKGLKNKLLKKQPEGSSCKCCSQYFHYSIPNQLDNTFICYSCTNNPLRQYY